jgi:hypothetical protein
MYSVCVCLCLYLFISEIFTHRIFIIVLLIGFGWNRKCKKLNLWKIGLYDGFWSVVLERFWINSICIVFVYVCVYTYLYLKFLQIEYP